MEVINIESTEETPKILFDKTNEIFELSGRSLPEDASEFYHPIIKWVSDYSASPNPETSFYFKLEYFNTASSKLILDLLAKIEAVKGAKVIWCYHDDDEDMEEAGGEFSELVSVPFEFQTY